MEYKSPTHPYRSGHLDRLWGYVHIYFSNQCAAAGNRRAGVTGDAHASDVRQSLPRDVRQSLPRDVRQSLPRDVRQSLPRDVRQSLPRDVRQSLPRDVRQSLPRDVRQSLPRDVRQSLPRDVRQSLPRDVRQSLPRDVRQSLPRVRDDLAAVLVVARRTPSLDTDVASMGLSWKRCGSGYWRVRGGLFALYVVEIDVVGPSEGDDLLYSLGHGKPTTAEARRFWAELTGSKEAGMTMQDMEGYEELMQKFLDSLTPEQRLAGLPPEQRLAGLPPEQRLAGLAPEQRLAGLDRDHQALALPVEVLRALSEDYLRSLGPEVQAELRRRLQQSGH